MLTKKLYLTSNIGGVYINRANYSFLYALELKWIASKRLEFFAEFYKNYLETRQLSIPNKRWLLGVGYYLRENFYCYSSYENGLDNEDLLNGGRFDIGFTYQF